MLDPQVTLRIIELAREWASATMPREVGSKDAWFNSMSENFDKAYKAIFKTVALTTIASVEKG